MTRTLARGLLALLPLVAGAPGLAADEATAPDEAKYAPMPWHLVDLWWDLGADVAFQSCSIDVSIGDDVPSDVNLYIAPIGLAHLDRTPFYGGIQTQADGTTRADGHLRKIGPGFLMSMWGERSPEAIRPADGGFFQSSGHEGDFVSVRRPHAWSKGKYTYRVVRMDAEEVGGKPYTWVGAFVHAHERDENLFVGALRFPGDHPVLSRRLANFVEIYGRRRPVAAIPRVTVAFGNPRVNGRPVEHPTAAAVYPKGVPDYAEVEARGTTLVVTVGTPVPGRTDRRVELLGR